MFTFCNMLLNRDRYWSHDLNILHQRHNGDCHGLPTSDITVHYKMIPLVVLCGSTAGGYFVKWHHSPLYYHTSGSTLWYYSWWVLCEVSVIRFSNPSKFENCWVMNMGIFFLELQFLHQFSFKFVETFDLYSSLEILKYWKVLKLPFKYTYDDKGCSGSVCV